MFDEFIKLFTGYQGDFGIADMSGAELDHERNKLKPSYEWAGRPITAADYQDHISGKISIGIQPCRPDKTAQFGCIDIDLKDYKEFKIEKYLALFQQYKLPLVPILSKSGGLHCYLFLEEPIPAIDLIEALKAFLLPLGLDPKTEIFPKQKELQKDEKGDIKPGNFINLPYYANGNTARCAVDKDNNTLSLEKFVEFVIKNKINKKTLETLVEKTHQDILLGTDPEFSDGPPCLALCSRNKLDDGRDRYMYNYMVFAKKKYKDKWSDHLMAANIKYLADPWDKSKLDSKIKAWAGDTAGHTCNEDPIASKCMRTLCYKQPFGVKSDNVSTFPEIQDFEMVMFEEPEYRFNIVLPDGSTEGVIAHRKQLFLQKDLLSLIWEATGIMHLPLKQKDFATILTNLGKERTKIYPPSGTQVEDRLKEELYQYCVNGPRARERAQVNVGSCLTEEGWHYFRYQGFLDHLGSGWKIPEERIAEKLTKKCGVEFSHSLNVEGKTLKVCRLKQLHTPKIEYKPSKKTESNY